MKRNRKIILVAHCLLNINAKVYGIAEEKGGSGLVGELIQRGYGIIQLPCIEMAMYGVQRWGVVYEQSDFPGFRNKCRELLIPIVEQVADYSKHEYEITAVIGADYSPTCGVNIIPVGSWGGEFNEYNNYQKSIDEIEIKKGKGIMMEELDKLLKEYEISTQFLAVDETNLSSYHELLDRL